MAGFRDTIIHHFGKKAHLFPFGFLQKISNQQLVLPYYHTISDRDMPHIQHLYPIKNTKEFIKDLDFLLQHYEPIDYFQFKELVEQQRQPKRPSFLLSFDDGLKEFHDIIAPILLKKGIPAVCFLNSGFVDNQDLFYRYKASLLVDKIKKEPHLSEKIAAKTDANQNVIQHILAIKYHNKSELDEIAKLIELDFDAYLSDHTPYLNSHEINTLIEQGFHFGAHSIDHPEYQFLKMEEQIRQTKESINFIFGKFSLDYKIFSFPFTDYKVSKSFFDKIKIANIATHTFGCAGQKKDTAVHNFQRIALEMKHLSAQQILTAELFYFLLKIPFGKNIIKRK